MSAVFSHVPRPPIVMDSHPDQRYFCPPGKSIGLGGVGGLAGKGYSRIEFYRGAMDHNFAQLTFNFNFGDVRASICLTADELREVARLCLDCAHDIETVTGVAA